MREEYIEKGTEIASPAQDVTSLAFIVQGIVDLKVMDSKGNYHVLESLE